MDARSVSELVELAEKEIEAVGAALDDGFEVMDVPIIVEACAKAVNAAHAEWNDLDDEHKSRLVIDLVDVVDEKYSLTKKAARKIVEWDVPWAPDAIVDQILDEDRLAEYLKFAVEELVVKVLERLTRREKKIGSRAFALLSSV